MIAQFFRLDAIAGALASFYSGSHFGAIQSSPHPAFEYRKRSPLRSSERGWGASAGVRQSGLGEPLRWAALPTCSMWRGFPHEELPKGFPDLRRLAFRCSTCRGFPHERLANPEGVRKLNFLFIPSEY